MKQFEYTSVLVPADETEEAAIARFNEAGLNGWEVIAIVGGNAPQVRIWLKREIVTRSGSQRTPVP